MDMLKLLSDGIKEAEERYMTLVHFYNERNQLYGTIISLLRLLNEQQIVITQEDRKIAKEYLVSFIIQDDKLIARLLKRDEYETGQESS